MMNEEIKTILSTQINKKYNLEIVWRNVIIMCLFHIGGAYGLYLILSLQCKLLTLFWLYLLLSLTGLGITAGSHRLWSHRSYKATWQLRVLLMMLQSMAFQNSIYEWVRDHRVHHKFTDTDADPHNSERGFFFSHVGWLLVKKHEDVKKKGKTLDMTDLRKDPIVMFQRKYYFILMPLCAFVLPASLPWYFFGETLWNSWWTCCLFRYVYTVNIAWFINSVGHTFGYRPYDQNISAAENKTIAFLALGEGWHNYHHVYPWDYKTAELPRYNFNVTLGFIDFMANIGWAYDLRTVSQSTIAKRIARTGISFAHHEEEKNIWGWDDADITEDDIADCKILYNKRQYLDPVK